jgi:dihydroxy-acid dehydratase
MMMTAHHLDAVVLLGSCGSYSYLGTANSMSCVAEALGMSVTGSAVIPATHAERLRAG